MNGDAELLRDYAESRSEAAFTEFVQRHLSLVYFAALRRTGGNSALAEEIAHYAFTEAARRAATLAHHSSLTGWLYTTTRNAAVMALRKERTRQIREQEASRMHELQSTETARDWETLRPLIDEALDKLPDRDRDAVLMRYFDDQPFAEIGTTLRISEDAARMRVERALEKLRGLLARRGVSSTAELALALEAHAVAAAPPGLGASVASAACAAAVAPATPVTLLAQFMANTKLIVGIGLVACVTGALAVREVVVHRRADAALAAAQRAYEIQTAETRVLARRVDDAEREVAAQTATLEQRRAEIATANARATPAAKPTPAAPAATMSPMKKGDAFLARHPDVKAALDTWANAAVDGKWSAFYRSRGLTAAQIEEFRFLTRARSFVPNAEADGEMLQLFTGSRLKREETERRLRTLLGAEGYAEYLRIVETKPARDAAGEVAGALCFSDRPLAPAQYTRLIETLHAHRTAADPATRSAGGFDWPAVTLEAASFLTPAQLAALDGVRAYDAFQDLWNRAPNPLNAARAPANPAK
jgi:RNA polymerase sigma factor (sigma-70 family)